MARRQRGLLGRKWRIKVRGKRQKREIKSHAEKSECDAERRAFRRRKMSGEEREGECERERRVVRRAIVNS